MESTIKKSEGCRPLRGEFISHRRSMVVLAILYVFAAYLFIQSITLGSNESWSSFVIMAVCGIYTVGETFADTYDASARDIQLSQPIRAGRRYLSKLLYIFLRSIVPTVLVLGIVIAYCSRLELDPYAADPIIISEVISKAVGMLLNVTLFNAIAVLALASTGTLLAAVVVWLLVGGALFRLYVCGSYVIEELLTSFFGGRRISNAQRLNGDLMILAFVVTLVLVAGTVYVRRDGQHTGRYIAGSAAVEVLLGTALLWFGLEVFGRGAAFTELSLVLLILAYVGVHILIFRKKTIKKIPVMVATFVGVLAVSVGVEWYMYTQIVDDQRDVNSEKLTAWASFTDSERGVDYKRLETPYVEITDSDWSDERWRNAIQYLSEPYCELMVGSYANVDTKWSNQYHISNADGSPLDQEQYQKLVDLLREYCSKNEYSTEHETPFFKYLFTGCDPVDYEYASYGFQVTISYDGGRSALRERCKGHLMTEGGEVEIWELIRAAGYKIEMVTNYRR